MAATARRMSPMYRLAMLACSPIVRWWGRLEVSGVDLLPESGPILLAGNHDSHWDPVAVGVSALGRRQVHALAKSTLWDKRGFNRILDGMGQIPIERGAGDAEALSRAIAELSGGACIGVFPEGTRSRGRELRARSGFGRMAQAVPDARIMCVAIEGTVDIARFPKRPRVRVRFFEPANGGLNDGETPTEMSARLLAEIRARVPVTACGRKPGAAADD